MKKLWHRSLAAQFISMLLLALLVSQGIGFLLSWEERGQALRLAAKGEFFSRTASLAQLLDTTQPSIRSDILRASDTSYTRFWITPAARPAADLESWRADARKRFAEPLPNLGKGHKPDTPLQRDGGAEPLPAGMLAATASPAAWIPVVTPALPDDRRAQFAYLDDTNGMGLTVALRDGQQLNAAFAKAMPNMFWTTQTTVSIATTAVILSIIGLFVAWRVATPLRRIAVAAEALGRGEAVERLPEIGPDDIRQTAEAFNIMQERLHRFVRDRTRMLAAIGHDLRTPLTSLRLRAEFVQDPEVREKMLNTIAEIQGMVDSMLSFARQDATIEATRAVDLTALVQSLCDDLEELGNAVEVEDGAPISYRCRPDALRRAVRNIVENAIRYGSRARVSVRRAPKGIEIIVDDDGPGIPADRIEQVFSPFFRLETSRSRETGGVGLGLSIARAITRHHGGDVTLENLPGGLRAKISLPPIVASSAVPATTSSDAEAASRLVPSH